MKLLVCDVEGTIFKANYRIDGTQYASTMWQPLAACLGEGAIDAEKATHEKWENGHYENYSEWVEATIAIHKDFGLHRDIFHGLIAEAEYHDGVVDFFNALDRKKYIPVLVSGGFQELIARAQKELKIKHGFGACEYFFDDTDGRLSGHNLKPCDFEGKYHYVENLFKTYGITNKDWVFIGDGKNDVPIAKKAPLSIGMKPIHPDLEKKVKYVVGSFNEVLLHLDAEERKLLEKEEQKVTQDQSLQKKEQFKDSSPISENQKLKERIETLEKQLKIKTREAKEATDRIHHTQKVSFNEFKVLPSDYTDTPKIGLNGLLADCRVVFSGLKDNYSTFKFLKEYHKNLTVITGSKKVFNTTPMEYADFIFTFKGCMGHPSSWKSEGARSKVPWANLSHRNTKMLENAMANVLIRAFMDSEV